MEYIYDAAGSKLAKILNGTVVNFYCGSVVYTGSKAVEYVAHSEGIAHKSGSTFSYQYNQTDHLGNVRSVANASNTVLQSTDYFPFGLAHSTSNLTKNKYLYNGKELQTELGFNMSDYGARVYDAILGVWHSIDPLAEKYHGMSPYVYCGNNPIRFIDPNGMDKKDPKEGDYDEDEDLWYSERFGWISEPFYQHVKVHGRRSKTYEQIQAEFLDGPNGPAPVDDEPWGESLNYNFRDYYYEGGVALATIVGGAIPFMPFVGSVFEFTQDSQASRLVLVLGVILDGIPGTKGGKTAVDLVSANKALNKAFIKGYTGNTELINEAHNLIKRYAGGNPHLGKTPKVLPR